MDFAEAVTVAILLFLTNTVRYSSMKRFIPCSWISDHKQQSPTLEKQDR